MRVTVKPCSTLAVAMEYSDIRTVQCSAVQLYCTALNSTLGRWNKATSVQYSTVQYSTVQYSTVQYSTVQYSTVHKYDNFI